MSVDKLIHVEVALVEDDNARRGVVQHEPLDHVVERGVEPLPLGFQPLLGFAVLPVDLANDQEQDQRDHQGSQVAAAIRRRVCARQSDSAAAIVLVATTMIGKRLSLAPAPSRSVLSTGL